MLNTFSCHPARTSPAMNYTFGLTWVCMWPSIFGHPGLYLLCNISTARLVPVLRCKIHFCITRPVPFVRSPILSALTGFACAPPFLVSPGLYWLCNCSICRPVLPLQCVIVFFPVSACPTSARHHNCQVLRLVPPLQHLICVGQYHLYII